MRRNGEPYIWWRQVIAANELGDDGRIESSKLLSATAVGSSFVVHRPSGLMYGGVGNNATWESQTVVFTPPNNRFYVITTRIFEGDGPACRTVLTDT